MRRTLCIAVCLLIGAVMTVAVAWLCAWHGDVDAKDLASIRQVDLAPDWPYWTEADKPHTPAVASRSNHQGDGHARTSTTRRIGQTTWTYLARLSGGWTREQALHGFGLPLPALWLGTWRADQIVQYPTWYPTPAKGLVGGYSLQHGLSVLQSGASIPGGSRLPVLLLYFGFTIDTVFYGGILYGGWSFIAAAIGWRRLAHGKCAKCKYPIGTAAVCSECGTRFPRR